ncbi:hypothetical protein BD560DRAFT_118645 [Blakeslea trispora]|nr:hypothetical protein BD560DRAFT_118645 [Blakeslea trispora]
MTAEKTSAYIKWILDNGGSMKKIEIRNDSEDIDSGIYATEQVEDGEGFFTIPFKICISERIARQVFPSCSNYSGQGVSAFFLLLEKMKGEESFYWPYINILPKSIKTAMSFDENDLAYIKNTNLESVVKERKANLHAEYKGILSQLPETVNRENMTWEEFLWSYSVFSSRAFPYTLIDPHTEDQSAQVLCPLADALNHKPNTKITWSREGNVDNGSLTFIAGEAYSAGDQVFNNYGPKSNEELLLGYGFCFEV